MGERGGQGHEGEDNILLHGFWLLLLLLLCCMRF